jgi:2-polyprenyl-6-methoxyphenol hydroxylase-like FAD-dependent oxidoreductase
MASEIDVLVVGAGPAGLALALDLARRGIQVVVAERGAGLFPGSRGKGLQPRTLEVFDDLGVLDAVLAAGGPYPATMIWKDGERLGEHMMFDAAEPSESEPYGIPWMLPQWRTQEILYTRLRELGATVEFGREVTGLKQDDAGVTVSFAAGRSVRARYVVGADGGRSTVRRLLGISMTGEPVAPDAMLVADVRITGLDRDHWHIFPGAGESDALALCPLAGVPDFQLFAQFPAETAIDQTLAGIRAVVGQRTHLTAEQVTEVRWASDFRLRAALADRFRDGRVFLAGDAAHIHPPTGGQGLNTSIQDAYNLAWKLGTVLAGGPPALLDTYEEERLPNAAAMLGLTTRVLKGEVRRGRETRQLGLGYPDSSLSVETRGDLPADALRAGDRAPDGRRAGIRLFDAFRGPHWTLLTVGTDPALPDLGIPVVRIPPYEPYGNGIFLIRPDGYIAWSGRTPHALPTYATQVGL